MECSAYIKTFLSGIFIQKNDFFSFFLKKDCGKKNFRMSCKKYSAFFAVWGISIFTGCSDFSDEESSIPIRYPQISADFLLYPNDSASNDSAAAHLATGVYLMVAPGASYELSFEIPENADLPELQIFRPYQENGESYINFAFRVKGHLENGRAVYAFESNAREPDIRIATLRGSGTDFYTPTIQNIHYAGSGIYSESFSLHIVQVGAYTGIEENDVSFDSLAHAIYKEFKAQYKGILIDTFYVSKASEHPQVGGDYPSDKKYIDDYGYDFYSGLTAWPQEEHKTNALELFVVHSIDAEGVLGYSTVFGQNMADSGYGVILATHPLLSMASAISLQDILATAVHEAGHFFGLRHTTATASDLMAEGDYSNLEDGLEDTPFCVNLLLSKKENTAAASVISGRVQFSESPFSDMIFKRPLFQSHKMVAAATIACPDESNVMYPIDTEAKLSFSESQLQMVRKNLTLIKH